MSLSSNPFSAFLGKFTANQDVLTTAATFLDRTHYSSSGHSGEGYHHYHYSSGKKKKKSIAMNALTLLSFLFFLNILQNCIQDHINHMNPTTIVMQMQTTMATIRKLDRKGDDGGELFNNVTFNEEVQTEMNKIDENIKEHETSVRVVKRKNTNRGRKRKKNENERKGVRPTRASIFIPEEEYQYTPIKLKTVERYNYKKKP